MISALLALTLLNSVPPPAAPNTAGNPAPAAQHAPERVPELVSAGAATAGFVGGALFAVPALFSVLPLGGPLVAAPVAIAILGLGAGFGGFLGALLEARLLPSLGAGGVTAGLAMLGAGAGAALGALALSGGDGVTMFLVAAALGAAGGLAGAAGGGALGTWLVSPPPRDAPAAEGPAGS